MTLSLSKSTRNHINAHKLTRKWKNSVKKVVQMLLRNIDMLACSVSEMPGIEPNFICHKLGEERRQVVEAEIDKLLKVDFIRQVDYTTRLANVAMVKK